MAPLLHLVFWRKGRFLAIPRRYQDEDRNRYCSWIWRTLKLGKRTSHEFKFTGFNLWDRVLPPEEIKQMANSFTKGTGTVNNWFDFADAPKSISSMEVLSPSQCIAPPQSEKAESPTSPPARDNTKESLSIDTMSRNLDWMLDLEYYSVCLLYSFFPQGLRKSHTISHSSYL